MFVKPAPLSGITSARANATVIASGRGLTKTTMIKTLRFNPFDYSDRPMEMGTIISLGWLPKHTEILGVRLVGFTTEIDVEMPDDAEG